ncbi:MAG: creatininase family protein [Candidatus Thorarchaeota archaeon]|jgi:creatinine amidohydrolase
MGTKYNLAKMTWPEVEERLKECDTIIVPIGSVEQHGPALPLDNDHFIAERVSEMVAEHLWPDIKVTVTPPIAFGYSPHHMDFKGTITLQESTLANVIVDVCASLAQHGFSKIVLINGHGGNETAISNALHILRDMSTAKVYHINWYEMAIDVELEVATPPVFHACDSETSVAWHVGQRVLKEKLIDDPGRPVVPGFIEPGMKESRFKIHTSYSMKDITDSGVIGYATKATKEKGGKIISVVIKRIEEFIRELNR